ncbi:MAG: aminotransferase class V-fold PLP-dependent enzyme [Pirellulales bacterium]|nr:aminotransferase class V-fold PLP-dependent enzyme [Pirellulales bacterium]
MPKSDRIYLDNAATSWPKPAAVWDAMDDCQRRLGASAGRAAYAEASEIEGLIRSARSGVAKLLGTKDPQHVVFAFNGTDALNLAIFGILRRNYPRRPHVVTTVCEHNSVLRPLRALLDGNEIEVTYVGCNSFGVVDADEFIAAVRPDTRLAAIVHASNVTGAMQPVEAIAAALESYDCRLLVDAAQTAGHVDLDMNQLGCDLLAAPGHKGLLGPLGTGVLCIRAGCERELVPFQYGGTGTHSEDDVQPESLPDRFESGNHNAPGLVGLGVAVDYLREQTIAKLRQHEVSLSSQLWNGLRNVPGVSLYGPQDPADRCGVISMNVAGFAPQEVAAMLDATCRIQVRAGLHCAPKMHEALGTLSMGGTVRFSVGPFNTSEEIAGTIEAVSQIASAGMPGR